MPEKRKPTSVVLVAFVSACIGAAIGAAIMAWIGSNKLAVAIAEVRNAERTRRDRTPTLSTPLYIPSNEVGVRDAPAPPIAEPPQPPPQAAPTPAPAQYLVISRAALDATGVAIPTTARDAINPNQLAAFPTPETFEQNFFPTPGPATPEQVAQATQQLVQSTESLEGYLSGHPAINNMMNSLKLLSTGQPLPAGFATGATQISSAQLLTPEGLQMANTAILTTLSRQLTAISTRTTESPESLQATNQIKSLADTIVRRQSQ